MAYKPIDVNEAERLYCELGDWKEVAGVLSHGRRTPFQTESVKNAVYRARKACAAAIEQEMLTMVMGRPDGC